MNNAVMSTLCYIEDEGSWLMMYRDRKEKDPNRGKWIGIGGKFAEGESPDECLLREVREETGIRLESFTLRGVITFVSDICGSEYIFLYTASLPGYIEDREEAAGPDLCREGTLEWVPLQDVPGLELWEGDRIFLDMLRSSCGFFSLKLVYRGDHLESYRITT